MQICDRLSISDTLWFLSSQFVINNLAKCVSSRTVKLTIRLIRLVCWPVDDSLFEVSQDLCCHCCCGNMQLVLSQFINFTIVS